MQINIQNVFSRRNLRMAALSLICVLGSFGLGIQTAGDIEPVSLIEAGSVELEGDMDDSGFVDLQDAVILLELVQGYEKITPRHLHADPDQDGSLTVDDALSILATLSLR